jgi:hypothetical protein
MSEWSDRAEVSAKAKGLVLHRPDPNELFIDIDDEPSLAIFHQAIGLLGSMVLGFTRAPSPSGDPHRFHIRVRLDYDLKNDFERIALQALLGSDRLHEMLSWVAAVRGVVGVTVLFEKPSPS